MFQEEQTTIWVVTAPATRGSQGIPGQSFHAAVASLTPGNYIIELEPSKHRSAPFHGDAAGKGSPLPALVVL